MSGKYMKLKRVIIPTITMILLASQLMGCSATDTQQAMNMLQESEQIELEYAVPEYGTSIGDDDQTVQSLFWIQLADLETHPDLRAAFEAAIGITTDDEGNKLGIVYTDENGKVTQNNTLLNALGNIRFANALDEEAETIEQIATDNYTDLEDNEALPAVINAYFELLPDVADGEFDGTATISRAQAMTLVMRATTPVTESGKPDSNSEFTSAVGSNLYTDFASAVDEYAFLNTSNDLNEQTFNGTMTRGEYIYMLTNALFGDAYAERLALQGMEDETLSGDLSLDTVKDGGNITIQEAIKNPENGIPTDMYNTLARAVALGFITEDDLNFDDAITKSDAIQLFIDASITSYSNAKFITSSEGTHIEGVNSEGLTIQEAITADVEYYESLGYGMEGWREYAQSQGADSTIGSWWIYYYGSGAGSERSYAINQRTGEKIIAGPNTFFYGTSHDDNGATPFYGGPNTIPGERYSENEMNARIYMGEDPQYLYVD